MINSMLHQNAEIAICTFFFFHEQYFPIAQICQSTDYSSITSVIRHIICPLTKNLSFGQFFDLFINWQQEKHVSFKGSHYFLSYLLTACDLNEQSRRSHITGRCRVHPDIFECDHMGEYGRVRVDYYKGCIGIASWKWKAHCIRKLESLTSNNNWNQTRLAVSQIRRKVIRYET